MGPRRSTSPSSCSSFSCSGRRSGSASRTSGSRTSSSFDQALPSIANLTGSPIRRGNQVQVLQNGDEFFPALLRGHRQGGGDRPPRDLRLVGGGDLRPDRQRAGRQGPRGGGGPAAPRRRGLEEGGRRAVRDDGGRGRQVWPASTPSASRISGLINNRTHRKLAILDGRVGYVFGHGIAKEWTGNGQDAEHWRDTGGAHRGAGRQRGPGGVRRELGGGDRRGTGGGASSSRG